MKVLVTGGCGFLGSHICEYYIKKGWDVIAYDNLTKYELVRTGYNIKGARDYNLKLLEDMGVVVIIGENKKKVDLEIWIGENNKAVGIVLSGELVCETDVNSLKKICKKFLKMVKEVE